jgi:hypothetical protein
MTTTDLFDPLTRAQQREFEKLLANGASPAAACKKLDVPLDVLWVTIDGDDRFVKRCQRVFESLNENVRAAIYQAAMQGKVTAQSNWLKLMQMEGEQEERSAKRKWAAGDSDAAVRQRAARLMALFRHWDEQAKAADEENSNLKSEI